MCFAYCGRVILTEGVVKGAGDRFIPFALEKRQTCRCDALLVLSVEIHCFERTVCQRMTTQKNNGRQKCLTVFVMHSKNCVTSSSGHAGQKVMRAAYHGGGLKSSWKFMRPSCLKRT